MHQIMRKRFLYAFFIVIIGSVSTLVAQNPTSKELLLRSLTTQYGWSVMNLTDAYLTELPYSGYGLQFGTTLREFVSPDNQRLSMRTDFLIQAGVTSNQPVSASISYFGGYLGYGLQSHIQLHRNLQLLLGGEWDAEFGVKVYSREVNNAFNMDLATNVNLAATLRYDVMHSNHRLRLQVDLRSPLAGIMFVPERGVSYSEIFYMGSSDNLFHLTSLHNKNGLNVRYLVQIPLSKSVLNLGLQTDFLKYAANDMIFKRNSISLQVGATCDLIQFGGRRNPAPDPFISTER